MIIPLIPSRRRPRTVLVVNPFIVLMNRLVRVTILKTRRLRKPFQKIQRFSLSLTFSGKTFRRRVTRLPVLILLIRLKWRRIKSRRIRRIRCWRSLVVQKSSCQKNLLLGDSQVRILALGGSFDTTRGSRKKMGPLLSAAAIYLFTIYLF